MSPANPKQERVIVVVDGSNLFHSLRSLKISNLLNFNYGKFAAWLAGKRKVVAKTYYVGAVREEQGKKKGKKLLSQQMKLFSKLRKAGFAVSLGYMLKTDGYHEKGVDVKMAVDLLVGAYEDTYDTAIIISSDTDLLPAIDKVVELKKKIEYVGFGHKPSFALQKHATVSRLLVKNDLLPFT